MTQQEKSDHIYDTEVASSIRSLFELTSRIDERVKVLFENSAKIEGRFEAIMENQNQLLQRVTALESRNGAEVKRQVEELNNKVQNMELKMQAVDIIARGHLTKWEKVADNMMKLLIALAASFIIWRAGWSNSPQPQPQPQPQPAPSISVPPAGSAAPTKTP
jgi:uncharacterized membrane protein YccC